jgi:uncharacterized C2H2 Zn-finger protein
MGEPSAKCPRCGASKEKFKKLSAEAVQLVERSRFTNSLHQALHDVLDGVYELAEAGIEDNLDPACVAIFKRAKEEAQLLQQFIKAEIEVHVGKGKWG